MIIYKADTSQRADVVLDRSTLKKHSLLGQHLVNVNIKLETYVDFSLGDYLNWNGTTYTVQKQPTVKKDKTNHFNYNIDFHAPQYTYDYTLYMLDGKTDFEINGDLENFLNLIVTNMNRTGSGYSVTAVPATAYKLMLFNGDSCLSALQRVCQEFDMEYRFDTAGKEITVGESLGTATGLTFQYKAGLRNIERKEVNDGVFVTRLWAYGSDRNIQFSTYGHERLRLPSPFYADNNIGTFGVIEKTKIFEEIYPRRNSSLTGVDGGDVLKFFDTGMDFDLNAYLSPNTAKITFNTGDLVGYTFEIVAYDDPTKEFTIKTIEDDQGKIWPDATFKPGVGDEYVLSDIYMPASYVTAAEAELLAAANAFVTKYSQPNVVYDIKPDPVYFETNVIQLQVGDLIDITDTDFGITISTKIISLDQSLANQYDYILRVGANAVVTYLTRIANDVVLNNVEINKYKNSDYFQWVRNRQRLNDLNTIVDSIFDPSGDYFDPTKIKPLSIETAALSVGAKPLNMQFDGLDIEPNYLGDPDELRLSACVMIHLTIEDAVRTWNIAAGSFNIPDTNMRYIYCVVASGVGITTGVWELDTAARLVDNQAGQYTFLIGIIHAEQNGIRGVSLLYGQTFINGRFITTGRIQSLDTVNYFDLDSDQFNLGDANAGIDWNVTTADTLTIRGALIQSQSGQAFPAFTYRGVYDNATTYYKGDGVVYNGSTYVYINATSGFGNVPTNGTYWDLYAAAGTDGNDGLPGDDGADGQTTYTWLKYADTPTSGMSDSPLNKEYIGLAYNKTTPVESTDYNDYLWSLFKGDQGVPGDPGADGTERWTWIKYADTPTTGMSDNPAGKQYLGLAPNKTTATESTNYGDYSWSLIVGETGPQGATGDAGTDGVDGAAGIDGTDGLDGADALDALVGDYDPAQVGGQSDFVIWLDTTTGGVANPGEIYWKMSKLVKSSGELVWDTQKATSGHQVTDFGEGRAGTFFVVWSITNLHTRFGSSSQYIDGHVMCIAYDSGAWKIAANNGFTGAITLVSTDVFIAAVEARQTTGGLTGLKMFVSGGVGYDNFNPNAEIYSFDNYVSDLDFSNAWYKYNGGPSVAIVGTGETGDNLIQIGNNSGNDQIWGVARRRIPFDPTALYKIEFRVRRTLGSGTFYGGVTAFDTDGNPISINGANTHGSAHYFAASAAATGSSWTIYQGYFRGVTTGTAGGVHDSIDDPGQIRNGARYISIMFIANYSGAAGVHEIDYCKLVKMEDQAVISGAWSSVVDYPAGSIVTYRGSTWQCIKRALNKPPTSNPTSWKLVSDNLVYQYRGEFTNGTRYYWTNEIRDIVKYSGVWYRYVVFATGGFVESAWSAGDWEVYGAQFELVATDLLLANGAHIADWEILDGNIQSSNNKTTLYGSTGAILLDGVANATYDDMSRITGDFVHITGSGEPVFLASGTTYDSSGNPNNSPYGHRAVISGKAFAAGTVSQYTAGIHGLTINDTIWSYGGLFTSIRSFGRIYANEQILRTALRKSGTYYLLVTDYHITCTGTSNIYLPTSPVTGIEYIIKRATSGTVTIHGNGINLWIATGSVSTRTLNNNGSTAFIWYDGSYWQFSLTVAL